MSLRPGETPGNAIAVFPFLKTTEPVSLGKFTFRSTDDVRELSKEDTSRVNEISEMLFLQDEFRIRSASYALLPPVNLDEDGPDLKELMRIQTIVAYCYSAPHPVFAEPFLRFENASLVIFSPEPVSRFLIRPEHHVRSASILPTVVPDQWERVAGFYGLYNFRHPFWVTKGSRLYPPAPHIGLNISQDLGLDLAEFLGPSSKHHLILELIRDPEDKTASRVLVALRWYNRANSLETDDDSAIVNLGVAFETLLGLPRDVKTERFSDAIDLLLGRVARLDIWAKQFYDARSMVAHEGRSEQTRFVPPGAKGVETGYRSLLADGRLIFQLCVSTLLTGFHLAVRNGLREKLETNQERFESICKILNDQALTPSERFSRIADAVAASDQYRFVPESGLLLETLVGAAQGAARALVASGLPSALNIQTIERLANAKRSADWYEVLDALNTFRNEKIIGPQESRSPIAITHRLAEVVWNYLGVHYFWLQRQKQNSKGT